MTTIDESKSLRPQHVAIVSTGSITIWSPTGAVTTIPSTHSKFNEITTLLRANKYEEALAISNPATVIVSRLETTFLGRTVSLDKATNMITVNGRGLAPSVARKAFELVDKGWSLEPLARFLSRMAENPSYQSQEQALFFLDRTGFALTTSGYVLGYRGLDYDYKDKHTHSFDNKPGRAPTPTISMERSQVDDNRDVACAAGLHIGSWSYARSWAGSGRKVICLINPRDIVAVPKDHNDEKMRVCRFLPLADASQWTSELDPTRVWDISDIPGSLYYESATGSIIRRTDTYVARI